MTSSDPSRTTQATSASPAAPSSGSAQGEPGTAATVVTGKAATAATVVASSGATDAATVITRAVEPVRAPDATRVADGAPALPAGVPTQIGGVTLARVLGSGAMGDVYLGRHATMDIDVAVKLMKVAGGSGEAERFLKEVRAAARIAHPNVIQVLHAGNEDGRLFLVMELVTGGDVAQLIRREGRVPWRRAVELMIQAGEGLGAAHRAGIVHRDVKPANFLLTTRGADARLKVADLGLAKLHQQQHQQASDIDLTQAGTVMGTPAYMAPEQAVDARRAGPPADVYALGVSLFQLLSGRLPFQAETSNAMLLAHANQPVPDLRAIATDVPESVVEAVRRMLAKSPEARPHDGDAAASELRAALAAADGPAASPAAVAPASPALAAAGGARAWIVLAVIAAALVVAGLAGGMRASAHAGAGGMRGQGPDATPTDVAPMAGAPAAGVARDAVAAADPWQSPTRASFVLANDALAAVAGSIESALLEARVLLVERAQLDQVMLKEIGLAQGDRVDLSTAVQAGKLVGAHVALLVRPANERVNLRVVLIQSGEMVGSDVVDADAAPSRALTLMRRALAQLPVQARLERDATGAWHVSAGRNHGVAVGDRFTIYAAPITAEVAPAEKPGSAPGVMPVVVPGAMTAVATVDAVEATSATVTLAGSPPAQLPALARRLAP